MRYLVLKTNIGEYRTKIFGNYTPRLEHAYPVSERTSHRMALFNDEVLVPVGDYCLLSDKPPSGGMTTYQLASSVAVIKNLMAGGLMSREAGVLALWDLIIEASPDRDVMYKMGTSAVVDKLIVTHGNLIV